MRDTRHIERRIGRITAAVATIGAMRPGPLIWQHTNPKGRRGSSWPISDPRAMKSHTESVRQECVTDGCRQIAAYKRFKTQTEPWIDVRGKASQWNMQIAKKAGSE